MTSFGRDERGGPTHPPGAGGPNGRVRLRHAEKLRQDRCQNDNALGSYDAGWRIGRRPWCRRLGERVLNGPPNREIVFRVRLVRDVEWVGSPLRWLQPFGGQFWGPSAFDSRINTSWLSNYRELTVKQGLLDSQIVPKRLSKLEPRVFVLNRVSISLGRLDCPASNRVWFANRERTACEPRGKETLWSQPSDLEPRGSRLRDLELRSCRLWPCTNRMSIP